MAFSAFSIQYGQHLSFKFNERRRTRRRPAHRNAAGDDSKDEQQH
jgi:hypothetical protein